MPAFASMKSEEVRMVRFRQTGSSWAAKGYLNFCAWKLFGTVTGPAE
jgi:hypothetical protein